MSPISPGECPNFVMYQPISLPWSIRWLAIWKRISAPVVASLGIRKRVAAIENKVGGLLRPEMFEIPILSGQLFRKPEAVFVRAAQRLLRSIAQASLKTPGKPDCERSLDENRSRVEVPELAARRIHPLH